jgi:AraC family transcriptional regulator of adaptative response/methylated-DNA-[protein]-cysteine methyltransferase
MESDDYGRVERAIRYLETHFREQPGLEDVARATGLSAFHFQRLFSRWAGISPKRFLQFLTAEYARGLLRESPSVLDAAYEAGLSGPGRLHDLIVTVHAATPGEMKARGAGLTIRYGIHSSPFGDCFIAITGKGICTLSFLAGRGIEEAIGQLRNEWQEAKRIEDAKATGDAMERIFDSSRQGNAIPLHAFVKGTNFQVKVWEALVRIPPGFAVSYEDVAVRIGDPKAVRAVGTAVGRNPVAFLIPCHRVIRKTGAFGNYRGGTARKMAILAWEGAKFR